MWGIIISILMAAIIGIIGEALAGHDIPGGALASIIAGFAGAWTGAWLFGNVGPVIGQFAVIPAIIGAALFVFILGLISRVFARAL
ncbi:GlsB/YeaQ/YmgE family stress response membrane protein [Paenibacillus sp. CAA11]|uniref:GlsB/YeaQ/YmgE family stress response membrane protein n=1 Tax=Paenibacillus sp. CAA11 TaxID=1532905 RepID=UPI000D36DD40|nr:GlsB/YeaQ/YmgE family stress response membrane protein [Paenibacillus sp. CAA11]AWB45978.1 GlsB/YeaQ/YmgE family stress response membrane protein [Paenibacillus sp. CAA11]